jgi:hypothetical protein
MITLILVAILFLALGYLLGNQCLRNKHAQEPMENKHQEHDFHYRMCHGPISDNEFLEHMIPHHQMAIDMGKQVSKYSDNPTILNMARNIVWTQEYEIWIMKLLLQSQPYFSPTLRKCPRLKTNETKPIMPYYYPCMSEDWKTAGECDPKFMKPCKKEQIYSCWRDRCPPYPVDHGCYAKYTGRIFPESKGVDYCLRPNN